MIANFYGQWMEIKRKDTYFLVSKNNNEQSRDTNSAFAHISHVLTSAAKQTM